MMWIDGVAAEDVLHGYVAAVVALLVFGIPAALQQQRYSPITKHAKRGIRGRALRLVGYGDEEEDAGPAAAT